MALARSKEKEPTIVQERKPNAEKLSDFISSSILSLISGTGISLGKGGGELAVRAERCYTVTLTYRTRIGLSA